MEKVTAYKCEFCKKILSTKSGMHKHENKCFSNPKSKSCITCGSLGEVLMLNGRFLTALETKILQWDDEKYYDIYEATDENGFAFDTQVFKPEHRYLEDANYERFCFGYKSILPKLKTNCDRWKFNSI